MVFFQILWFKSCSLPNNYSTSPFSEQPDNFTGSHFSVCILLIFSQYIFKHLWYTYQALLKIIPVNKTVSWSHGAYTLVGIRRYWINNEPILIVIINYHPYQFPFLLLLVQYWVSGSLAWLQKGILFGTNQLHAMIKGEIVR